MMNEKGPQGGEGEDEKPVVTAEEWKKVQEQLSNLTKGIATYRDEAKNAVESARAAADALEAYKAESAKGKKSDDEVELSAEDQKKFDAWASKQGFLTKDELAQERSRIATESAKDVAKTAVSEFLEKHPEYDDDEKWEKVQAEFGLYKTPADLASYRALLEKVHKNLSGGSSKDKAKAEAKADAINRSRLNLGGGGNGGGSSEDEAAVENLQKRYPNLSREQIEARLGEIKQLYPKK